MSKKITTISIVFLILASALLVFNANTSSAATVGPSKLSIVIGPTSILADNNTYKIISVQLQDDIGKPARALQDTTISLSSSSTNVGSADSTITIIKGSTYALANFNSTTTPGTTTITATATGYTTVQASVTTLKPGVTPSRLAVFCVPQTLPADASTYQAIQVQLMDAVATDVTVNLFSSNPAVGTIVSTLTVPAGKTQATAAFTATNQAGSTTVTAAASNYTTVTAPMTTYLIDYSPLQVTVTAKSSSINNGNTSQISAYITADGAPIVGASVTFTSNNGGTFSAQAQGEGYYNATFTAPNFSQTTTCTIKASATKTDYLDSEGMTQVIVTPNEAPTQTTAPTNDGATIQLCIKDINDNPLNNTLVTSIVQPAGMTKLTDITNSSGYVTFQNAAAGSYTFNIIRQGNEPMNATIDVASQPMALTITLLGGNTSASFDSTVFLITGIVIVIIAVAIVSSLVLIRRKKSERIRKLHELQAQLKRKY